MDTEELLKKVKVENDLGTAITYEVKVTCIRAASGKELANGSDLKTEKYIDTSGVARYELTLFSSNMDGSVYTTGKMYVNILDDFYENQEVRFVSKEFIETVNPRSKWQKQNYVE